LLTKGGRFKFIRLGRRLYRILFTHIGLFVFKHGLACAFCFFLDTYNRPVVLPAHGLKVNNPAVHIFILEVDKPIFTRLRVYPSTLVRSVGWGAPLMHSHVPLVRAVNVFRAQYKLPACRNTASGGENIIVTVSFVEFRSLDSRVNDVPIVYYYAII